VGRKAKVKIRKIRRLRAAVATKVEQLPHYLVMAAVRGPDHGGTDSMQLKAIVTARIRGIIYPRGQSDPGCWGDIIITPLTQTEVEDVEAIVPRLTSATRAEGRSNHYLNHLFDAVSVTVRHPIWGGLGSKLATALKGR